MTDIHSVIEARKDELFQLLSDLIKIDSQSNGKNGNEKKIAFFIADYLRGMGIEPDVYTPLDIEGMREHPDFWKFHNLEERYNVSAVIPGRDRSRRLMLAAHSDTVAVGNRENWTVDPFGGEIKDGKIWGRGACDDKYGIATSLFLIKVFRDEGIEFPMDIVFTAYCNEEYGGSHGALAACLRYPCDEIISIDCKDFEIWNCAIGGGEFKLHLKAKNAVEDCGAMFEGLKAVYDEMDIFRQARKAELLQHEEYKNSQFINECVKFIEMKAGNSGADLNHAHVEVCYYASSDEESINREFDEMIYHLNERLEPFNIEVDRFEKTTRFFHFEKSDKNNPLVDALIRAAKNTSGRTVTPIGACQSDLSIFLKYGSHRAIGFGAGRPFGAYGGAHQIDEYIECDRLLELTQIMGELLNNEI